MTLSQQRKFVLGLMLLVWLSWSVFGADYHVRSGAYELMADGGSPAPALWTIGTVISTR